MKKINTPTADNGMFVDGNPSVGRKATQFNAEWCNNVQMELWNAIKKVSGSDPAGAQTMDDLATALDAFLGKVLVDNSDGTPGKLISKFYDQGSAIGVSAVNVGTGHYIAIGIKQGAVDTDHLKDSAVESAKIKDGAVTTPKIPDGNVTTQKLANNAVIGAKFALSVIDKQYAAVMVSTTDIVDQPTSACDVTVHTFSLVDTGGFIDINLYADARQNSNYMTDVKFELRKSGSTTVEREFDVGTPSTTTTVSRRMVVKNGSSAAANYELHLTCKANFSPGGVPISGFQAYGVDIRGVSLA